MKVPPYEIGSYLKHQETEKIVRLIRYPLNPSYVRSLSIGGGTTRSKLNFNRFYGRDIETKEILECVTKEFLLVEN